VVGPAPRGPHPLTGTQAAGAQCGGTRQYRQYLLPEPPRNRGLPAIRHWGLAFLSQRTHTADRPYKTLFWLQ
jgi:hypothetical protein